MDTEVAVIIAAIITGASTIIAAFIQARKKEAKEKEASYETNEMREQQPRKMTQVPDWVDRACQIASLARRSATHILRKENERKHYKELENLYQEVVSIRTNLSARLPAEWDELLEKLQNSIYGFQGTPEDKEKIERARKALRDRAQIDFSSKPMQIKKGIEDGIAEILCEYDKGDFKVWDLYGELKAKFPDRNSKELFDELAEELLRLQREGMIDLLNIRRINEKRVHSEIRKQSEIDQYTRIRKKRGRWETR